MISEVPGVRVGHWTDLGAGTGCTVVLFGPAAVASGEVRGGASATREFSLLDPLATVQRVDAVVLTGGSAFGLAAADGVVGWCEERGQGFPTPHGPVPIVVAMALYDLGAGDPAVRPGPAQGRSACESATGGPVAVGRVGAGAGARIGTWRGVDRALPGGLVGAVRRRGELVVAAVVAVNAWGDVAGTGHDGEPWPDLSGAPTSGALTNTTIGVVVTNAVVDKAGCHHVARGAHDGLARAVMPPHAAVDGDAFVAAATGTGPEAPVELVRAMAVEVVDEAIRSVGQPR